MMATKTTSVSSSCRKKNCEEEEEERLFICKKSPFSFLYCRDMGKKKLKRKKNFFFCEDLGLRCRTYSKKKRGWWVKKEGEKCLFCRLLKVGRQEGRREMGRALNLCCSGKYFFFMGKNVESREN